MEKRRVLWIDGLKLLACMFVFWGHYTKAFSSPLLFRGVDVINNTIFSMVLNGEFWVCIFCLLSGYFASKKTISNCKKLFLTSVMRYFRFAVPLLFVHVIILGFDYLIGFSANNCGIIIENTWICSYYTETINIGDVLKSTILLSSKLNAPFWIIRSLLLGSIVIYFLNYIILKMSWKWQLVIKTIFTIACFVIPNTFFVGACLLGAWLGDVWKCKCLDKSSRIFGVISGASVLMLCGCQNYISKKLDISWLVLNEKWHVLYAFVVLISLEYMKIIKEKLESYYIVKNREISFVVYLLHWPILCSFSAFTIMQGVKFKISYTLVYLACFILSNIVILLCAKIYTRIVERATNVIVQKINTQLERVVGLRIGKISK